jgi:hypothetical protein
MAEYDWNVLSVQHHFACYRRQVHAKITRIVGNAVYEQPCRERERERPIIHPHSKTADANLRNASVIDIETNGGDYISVYRHRSNDSICYLRDIKTFFLKDDDINYIISFTTHTCILPVALLHIKSPFGMRHGNC